MSVNLQKGQKISLSKESASNGNSGLNNILIGLGWDEVSSGKGFLSSLFNSQQDIDCDASAFLLKNGKLINKTDIVYFGNLKHKSGALTHTGDNLTGAGEGDDEQIIAQLQNIPLDYDRIVFVVNIYDATSRKQHFGMLKNAFIRIVDAASNKELCRFNLSENYDGMTAMVFGEIYRHENEWKFNAVGQPTKDDGILALAKKFM